MYISLHKKQLGKHIKINKYGNIIISLYNNSIIN